MSADAFEARTTARHQIGAALAWRGPVGHGGRGVGCGLPTRYHSDTSLRNSTGVQAVFAGFLAHKKKDRCHTRFARGRFAAFSRFALQTATSGVGWSRAEPWLMGAKLSAYLSDVSAATAWPRPALPAPRPAPRARANLSRVIRRAGCRLGHPGDPRRAPPPSPRRVATSFSADCLTPIRVGPPPRDLQSGPLPLRLRHPPVPWDSRPRRSGQWAPGNGQHQGPCPAVVFIRWVLYTGFKIPFPTRV